MKKNVYELFLLSVDEYKRFEDTILSTMRDSAYWWLRSQGENSHYAAYVIKGTAYRRGYSVSCGDAGVRPAIIIPKDENLDIGSNFLKFDFPFTVIGHSKEYTWLLADVPMVFDKFDVYNNNYETSYIKNEVLPKLAKKYNIHA